ncbi:MAG: glycosyltransferase family 4 protein [Acidobacteriaceae bacterium]
MRVLQLISSRGYYGAENVVYQLATQLKLLGDRVAIALLERDRIMPHPLAEQAEESGIVVYRLRCESRMHGGCIGEIRRLLRTQRFDVLHTHNYKSNLYGYLASRLLGIPILATCHNWTDTTAALRLYGALDRQLLAQFDRIVTVSASTRTRLSNRRIPTHRIITIGNGVPMPAMPIPELSLHHDPRIPRGSLSDCDESPGGGLVVGVAARLSFEKGVDVFLRAAAEVMSRHPGMRFVIAGDGPERERLEALARELHLSSTVTFLGFCADMQSFLRTLDIVVQPSRVDAMPMSVLEAMAHGLPVIASAVGGLPDILDRGSRGKLVPPEDADRLAQGILELSRDGALRSRLGIAARGYVAQHCSAEAMAQQYRNLYLQSLQERAGTATLAAA